MRTSRQRCTRGALVAILTLCAGASCVDPGGGPAVTDDAGLSDPDAGGLPAEGEGEGEGEGQPHDDCPDDPARTSPGLCGCGTPLSGENDDDTDGTANCADGCPNDTHKTAPGACGCGAADGDTDNDGVLDCDDVCASGDDSDDADGDTIPDACDGCSGGSCGWPAEGFTDAENLTSIEGPFLTNDFRSNLSGAFWDPVHERLWICRNGVGDSKVWAAKKNASGGFEIEENNGQRGEWTDFGDIEGMTMAWLDDATTVYLIVERVGDIIEADMSVYGTVRITHRWHVVANLPGGEGAEAIAFVPDQFLIEQGFVDGAGAPYVSQGGMGGLMFVGHQGGGGVFAFDLNRTDDTFTFVGGYKTAETETADLSFDASTGLLYALHGGSFNDIEAMHLSSTLVGEKRKLDTVELYEGPDAPFWAGTNYEGLAIAPATECTEGRDLFLTIDGGNSNSLLRFRDFPCR